MERTHQRWGGIKDKRGRKDTPRNLKTSKIEKKKIKNAKNPTRLVLKGRCEGEKKEDRAITKRISGIQSTIGILRTSLGGDPVPRYEYITLLYSCKIIKHCLQDTQGSGYMYRVYSVHGTL